MTDNEDSFNLQPPPENRREETNARKRAWRMANPDKVKAIKKRCREKDPVKYSAQRHASYEAHKEERKADTRNRRLADPEKAKASDKASREKNRDKILARSRETYRTRYLGKAYDLTPEEQQAIEDEQGNCCPICDTPFIKDLGARHPCVDHDHVSGTVRGVLCRLCNMGIGQMRDDPKLLRAAARYLKKYKEPPDVT
jgi:Recombination endonuclease VII